MFTNLDIASAGIWFQSIVLLGGFICAYIQLKHQSKDSRARIIIELKQLFYDYHEITTALRPGGKWNSQIPDDSESWAKIDHYLGLFEHCEYLLSKKLIDKDFFAHSHKVKLENAIYHKDIVQKIKNEKEHWVDLLILCKSLNINVL